MIKRIFIVLFLVVVLLQNAQAQFGFELGFRTGIDHSPSFKKFSQSYNSVNKSGMKKELNNFGIPVGWGLGVDYTINGFFSSVRFNNINSWTQAKYDSGAKRHFKHTQFLYSVLGGFGVAEEEFNFNASIGLAFGSDRIESYYEYSDGSKSYGREKTFNGVFSGSHYSYVGAVTLGKTFEEIGVYIRAEYLFGFFAGIKSHLTEHHWNKKLEILTDFPSGLPTDIEKWNQMEYIEDYPEEETVAADFKGLRLEIGLRFQLKNDR